MEVRCGACNKLFRVSDDKITGRGIKFPCTRCGEYVKITQEDLQNYTLSQSTVSALDLFEPKAGPAAAPLSAEAAHAVAESMAVEPAAATAPEDVKEEKPPSFFEPVQSQPASAAKPEPAAEPRPEPLMKSKSTQPASVTEPEPAAEPKPEPLMRSAPKTEPPVEPQTESQEEPSPLMEAEAKTAPIPASSAQPSKPKAQTSRPAAPTVSPVAEHAEQERMPSSMPFFSGKMILLLIGALIVLGLAGYGAFVYLQPPPQKKVEKAAPVITSIDGLEIVNSAGTMDANGDLIVTGDIANAADTAKSDWYVVVEVYDAQGAVLTKIRLLNGNQIYSKRDFDILAKRGVNVQELKTKLLQPTGSAIPPTGRVKFEARFVQPLQGISSFVAQVVPFDRAQLYKEIAEEIK